MRLLWLVLMFAFLACVLTNTIHAETQTYPSSYTLPNECLSYSNPDAASNIPPITSTGTDIALALLALSVSFDTVAIAYMVSRIFPHLGLRNWVQNEFWEIVKSALLIASIYSIITLIGAFTHFLVPSAVAATAPHPIFFADVTPVVQGAETYLCTVNTNLVYMWEIIGIMSGGTGFWSAFKVAFYIPFPLSPPTLPVAFWYLDGVSFMPFANWALQTGNFFISPYGSIMNDLVNFVLFPSSSVVLMLITTLPTLASIGLAFFIPIGLIFRAFPFIRGIGGTMIAIGITLALVVPAIFVVFNYTVTSALTQTIAITPVQPQVVNLNYGGFTTELCSVIDPFGLPGCTTFIKYFTPITLSFNIFSSGISGIANFFYDVNYSSEVFSPNAIFFFMNQILGYGAYVVLQLVLFAIDLMLFYPIADSIARALGGSIRLQIGGKLRLAS